MTEQDVKLLLLDLCARLPYGVKIQYNNEIYYIDYISALYEEVKLDIPDNYTIGISEIKPYLRPISSMTEEESEEFSNMEIVGYSNYDWLNAHHFDFRNLIEKGLAIEVTEENNPYK